MANDTNFDRVMEGLSDAIDIANGRADPKSFRVHVPRDVDVKAIRGKLHLTQTEFAARFGFPIGTVRDWEQGRSRPEQATRVFLMVIDREPAAVMRALEAA